ncbi:MAG: CoA transferase [Nitratireductor sp.]
MKPLSGITVVDFSRVLAGPMATQILGELGARIIKIERPDTGDEARQWEPRLPDGDSAYFFAFNRGKESVSLNLKSEEGRRIARELAGKVDVVVENFLPGVMDSWGLGYEALSKINPRLVYVSNTGFGQSGPYMKRNGYDTIFQALSGMMALTGEKDGPPAKVGLPIADLTSGLWITIAALVGLIGRGQSERGTHIDVAMLDIQVSLLTIAASRFFATGEDPRRAGTEHPGRVPSAAFQCRDGSWLHISASDQHWAAVCDVLQLDKLASDRDLDLNAGRVTRREEVMQAMTAAIAKRERTEIAEALRAAGVPAGEVNSVREILSDRHIAERGMVQEFDHPTAGKFPALRTPLQFSGFENPKTSAPPLLGTDTDAVLSSLLGLSSEAIGKLRERGAI